MLADGTWQLGCEASGDVAHAAVRSRRCLAVDARELHPTLHQTTSSEFFLLPPSDTNQKCNMNIWSHASRSAPSSSSPPLLLSLSLRQHPRLKRHPSGCTLRAAFTHSVCRRGEPPLHLKRICTRPRAEADVALQESEDKRTSNQISSSLY